MLSISFLLTELAMEATPLALPNDILPLDCQDAVLFNPLAPCPVSSIYVTRSSTFFNALANGFHPICGSSFFLTDCSAKTDTLPDFTGFHCNIVITPAPLFEAHCCISQALQLYCTKVNAIRHNCRGDASVVLRLCSTAFHIKLIFVDPQLRLILNTSSSETMALSMIPGLEEDNCTHEGCMSVFPAFPPDSKNIIIQDKSGTRICTCVLQDSVCVGYLFGTGSGTSESLLQKTLLCCRLLNEQLRGSITYTSRHGIAMNRLTRRLCSDEPVAEEEFRKDLSMLKNKTYKFCRIGIIRFEADLHQNPHSLFLEALRTFPQDNLTWYENQIFVLVSSPSFQCESRSNMEDVEAFLTANHGYVMFSNVSQNVRGLQQMCHNVFSSIDMAWTIHPHFSNSHVMYFSDYAIYHVIDGYYRHHASSPDPADVMFCCHPAIITLMRYDNAKDGNLCDFFFYYLRNEHNIAKTASHFYMHRNTAIYQRDKIAKMIHYEFDDPEEDFNLLFSLYLTNYRKYYQQLPIRIAEYDKSEY